VASSHLSRCPAQAPPAGWGRMLADVRFAHEDAVAGEHVAALDERRHPRRDGFIVIVSSACRAPPGSVAGLGSAAAPLPLLGANAPAVRVGLPLGNRDPVDMAEGASIVMLSSRMTDHGERSYPQFVSPRVTGRVHEECRSTDVSVSTGARNRGSRLGKLGGCR
jgi:hypothetical protein